MKEKKYYENNLRHILVQVRRREREREVKEKKYNENKLRHLHRYRSEGGKEVSCIFSK